MKTSVPDTLITIFGRNAVHEALADPGITPWRLHLSSRNRPAPVLDALKTMAGQRGIEVAVHAPEKLARISRNGRQDQGVALDILAPGYQPASRLLDSRPARCRLLALDRIQNPQNLGMIIRSAVAGFMDGIVLPERETSGLNPLSIKASAGTVFRASIYRCATLMDILPALQTAGFTLYALQAGGTENLLTLQPPERAVFILGNESSGIQPAILSLADHGARIPMRRDTESLNVAAAAAVLSFLPALQPQNQSS